MSTHKRRAVRKERPRPPRGRPAEETDLRDLGRGPAIDIRLGLPDGSVPAGVVLAGSTVERLRQAALAAGGVAKELGRIDPYGDVDLDPAAVGAACHELRGDDGSATKLDADVARAVEALRSLAAKGQALPGARVWALGN